MLEFHDDDDFGGLYTDLESEAKESGTLTKLQGDCDASEENEIDEEQKRGAAAEVEKGQYLNGSRDRVENVSESESEDDFNIVLNDNGKNNLDYNCKVNAAKIGREVDDEDGNRGEEVDEGNNEVENVENGGGGGGGGGKFGCYGGGFGAQLKVSLASIHRQNSPKGMRNYGPLLCHFWVRKMCQ